MATPLKKLQKASDPALVRLFQRGSNRAFDVLVQRHTPRLKTYAHTLLHNTENEKDVLQQLWLFIMERLQQHRYKETGHFNAWLPTVLYRKACAFLRTQRKAVPLDVEMLSQQRALVTEPTYGSDDYIAKVKAVIDTFNANLQRIIAARIFEDKTFPEIGSELDKSSDTVRKDFARGIQRLRKKFRGKK